MKKRKAVEKVNNGKRPAHGGHLGKGTATTAMDFDLVPAIVDTTAVVPIRNQKGNMFWRHSNACNSSAETSLPAPNADEIFEMFCPNGGDCDCSKFGFKGKLNLCQNEAVKKALKRSISSSGSHFLDFGGYGSSIATLAVLCGIHTMERDIRHQQRKPFIIVVSEFKLSQWLEDIENQTNLGQIGRGTLIYDSNLSVNRKQLSEYSIIIVTRKVLLEDMKAILASSSKDNLVVPPLLSGCSPMGLYMGLISFSKNSQMQQLYANLTSGVDVLKENFTRARFWQTVNDQNQLCVARYEALVVDDAEILREDNMLQKILLSLGHLSKIKFGLSSNVDLQQQSDLDLRMVGDTIVLDDKNQRGEEARDCIISVKLTPEETVWSAFAFLNFSRAYVCFERAMGRKRDDEYEKVMLMLWKLVQSTSVSMKDADMGCCCYCGGLFKAMGPVEAEVVDVVVDNDNGDDDEEEKMKKKMLSCGHVLCDDCANKNSSKYSLECHRCQLSSLSSTSTTSAKKPTPSTRIKAAISYVLEQFQQSGQKIVVFSKFPAVLALLRTSLDGKKYTVLTVDNTATVAAMATTLKAFRKPCSKNQVLLVSTQLDKTKVNLTMATHVVFMEKWHEHKFARHLVHFIGQTDRTRFCYIKAENSVDDIDIPTMNPDLKALWTSLNQLYWPIIHNFPRNFQQSSLNEYKFFPDIVPTTTTATEEEEDPTTPPQFSHDANGSSFVTPDTVPSRPPPVAMEMKEKDKQQIVKRLGLLMKAINNVMPLKNHSTTGSAFKPVSNATTTTTVVSKKNHSKHYQPKATEADDITPPSSPHAFEKQLVALPERRPKKPKQFFGS